MSIISLNGMPGKMEAVDIYVEGSAAFGLKPVIDELFLPHFLAEHFSNRDGAVLWDVRNNMVCYLECFPSTCLIIWES